MAISYDRFYHGPNDGTKFLLANYDLCDEKKNMYETGYLIKSIHLTINHF